MTHLKRHAVPKTWPIARKGTTFVIKPSFGFSKGMPLLVILRDMLKIVKNRKEAKKAIYMKNILVNGKDAKDEKDGVVLFDVVTIVPSEKSYRLTMSNTGKFDLEETDKNNANKKIAKIVGKTILKGKKIQLNLSDGKNFLSDIKCKTNDSALIDFKSKKIEKCIPLKNNSEVFIFAGKHSGKKGKIENIDEEKKIASINDGKEKINVLIKQFIVTE